MEQEKIIAYVPASLPNLEDFSNITENALLDKIARDRIRLIFHLLYASRSQTSRNSKKRNTQKFIDGYVSISSALLKQLVTSEYSKYLNFMEEKGFIERYRDSLTDKVIYSAYGHVCQFIRIHPKYLVDIVNDRHYRKEFITSKKVIKAIERQRIKVKERQENANWNSKVTQAHKKIIDCSTKIRFRSSCFADLNKKVNKSRSEFRKVLYRDYMLLIEQINDGLYDHGFTICDYGNRLHYFLTNMASFLRKHIYFLDNENKLLANIDIKNCQPYIFSAILVNPNIIKTFAPEFNSLIPMLERFSKFVDVKAFHLDCHLGVIYDYFVDTICNNMDNGKPIDKLRARNISKKKLIGFLYSNPNGQHGNDSNKNYSKKMFKAEFKRLYPNVFDAACFIKSNSIESIQSFYYKDVKAVGPKTNLPCLMQRIESRILLGIVAPRLIEAGIQDFVTIHDSFVVLSDDQVTASEIVINSFSSLGIRPPNLKCDLLSCE